jgi:Zn-finger nucleic acid-binding protein
MGGPEPLCPGCRQELRTSDLSGVSVRVCGQCHGTLLAQIDMIRMLEAMSVELLKSIDPDTKLNPVGKADGTVACPACSRTMARDDYCAAGIAHFDRCEPCRLLWLGADELGTMTMMWARMERRLERAQKQTQEALAEADSFVGSVMLGRAAPASKAREGAFSEGDGLIGVTASRILSRLI